MNVRASSNNQRLIPLVTRLTFNRITMPELDRGSLGALKHVSLTFPQLRYIYVKSFYISYYKYICISPALFPHIYI